LSDAQFALTVSLHIIYLSFTIGLAMWPVVLEALSMLTASPSRWAPPPVREGLAFLRIPESTVGDRRERI
jgi:hypothetical protein